MVRKYTIQWTQIWHIFIINRCHFQLRDVSIGTPNKIINFCVSKYWDSQKFNYFFLSQYLCILRYINVSDLLKCKTSSHQTLHSASPICTDLAGILTWWPWPIFWAPLPFTHFTSTFNISSTIRPTTIKPCIVLLHNVRTLQIPWLGGLDLYFTLHWLLHLLGHPSICPQL